MVNQLEEDYHFNLKNFSFIYNEKKAFIIDIREQIKMITPFLHYRKELTDYIDVFYLPSNGGFAIVEQFNTYLGKSMQIIANMLDSTRMGSIESYLDHIWKEFDLAIDALDSIEPMQIFVTNLSSIITMIDYSVELQLSDMTEKEKDIGLISNAIKNINSDLEIIDVLEITPDGSIKRLKIKETVTGRTTTNKSNSIEVDLKNIKTLNTKAI